MFTSSKLEISSCVFKSKFIILWLLVLACQPREEGTLGMIVTTLIHGFQSAVWSGVGS